MSVGSYERETGLVHPFFDSGNGRCAEIAMERLAACSRRQAPADAAPHHQTVEIPDEPAGSSG